MRPNPLIATLTAIISISVFQFPIQNAHNIGGIFSVNEETGTKRQSRKNPKQIANHKSQPATLNYYIEKLVFGFLWEETVIDFDYLPITVIWASFKYAQHCEASAFAGGVHLDRVTGGDCDHRDTGRDAASCLEQG